MSCPLTALALLEAVLLWALPLPAAELMPSPDIRQTFHSGDADRDLDIDDVDRFEAILSEGLSGEDLSADVNGDHMVNLDDANTVQENLGATTSGVISSDGGTFGYLDTAGSQIIAADGIWQQFIFTQPLNSPSYWGALESLQMVSKSTTFYFS